MFSTLEQLVFCSHRAYFSSVFNFPAYAHMIFSFHPLKLTNTTLLCLHEKLSDQNINKLSSQ